MTDKRTGDITPKERELLSFIRKYPGMPLGQGAGLAEFEAMIFGYSAALTNTNAQSNNVLLPDGFNEFVAKKYLGKSCAQQPVGLFNIIRMQEKDNRKALSLFFSLLDEYLVHLGYEPVPEYKALF